MDRPGISPFAHAGRDPEIESFLRRVELGSEGERAYFETHFRRLVQTLSLVPAGGRRAGRDRKRLGVQGEPDFFLNIDLFDAERHAYPYPDASLDVVLCCEVIEHLIRDPMHLLFECHRILIEGGLLVLTIPNAASLSSVTRVLHGWRNPQDAVVAACF